MPLYEYQCTACKEVSEILQKFSDPPPAQCPRCAGGPLHKVLSPTSFQLKGGGWYADAYSSKKAETTKPEKPAGGAEAGAAAASSEAPAAAEKKPEAPKPAAPASAPSPAKKPTP